MRVALLGYGTVGRAVRQIVDECTDTLEIAWILRRRGACDEPCMTDSFEKIVTDPDVDAVVEVMGGVEPARSYILQALAAGKHVVTANKAVVAQHFDEFIAASEASGTACMIEATCGGGIPWIRNITRARRIDTLTSFSGILNGTTNFIIDEMQTKGVDFEQALCCAQKLGYAEADPSSDIDGHDVAYKAAISASLAFGCPCVLDFPVFGIRNLTKADINLFAGKGFGIKLMAHGVCRDARYAVVVEPTLIDQSALETRVFGNYNVATLVGATIGELKFYGQGAGGLPTGNACVQDLLDIQEGFRCEFASNSPITYDPSLLVRDYLIRAQPDALPAEGDAYEAGYHLYHGLTAEEAHRMMSATIAADPRAYLIGIPACTTLQNDLSTHDVLVNG